jgi:hypothetical protein
MHLVTCVTYRSPTSNECDAVPPLEKKLNLKNAFTDSQKNSTLLYFLCAVRAGERLIRMLLVGVFSQGYCTTIFESNAQNCMAEGPATRFVSDVMICVGVRL